MNSMFVAGGGGKIHRVGCDGLLSGRTTCIEINGGRGAKGEGGNLHRETEISLGFLLTFYLIIWTYTIIPDVTDI